MTFVIFLDATEHALAGNEGLSRARDKIFKKACNVILPKVTFVPIS